MASTTKSGQIVPAKQQQRTLAKELVRLQPEIARALPRHLDADRMSRVFLTSLRTTPKLAQCTLPSFLGSVLQLAQLGLDPSSGLQEAFLIPRSMNGVMTCTTIIGFQGMLEIAYRSGKVSNVYAEVVHAGDSFEYELGLHPDIRHVPDGDEDGPVTHAYAVAELKDGRKAFRVLTAKQVAKRAGSSTAKSGPWTTHPEAMAKKTALRALFKYLPKSAELAQVAAFDEAPEYGKKQTAFLTHETRETLEQHGIDVDSDETPALDEAK